MGQYHKIVNLDKAEFLNPHQLATGLKLWEQLANSPGTGTALIVLLASASNGQGSGDLRTDDPAGMIGRWRGDRIAMVGDYDESFYTLRDGRRLAGVDIYQLCIVPDEGEKPLEGAFVNVSLGVRDIIAAELQGRYEGDGWCSWTENEAVALF